jgi:hypothetical protein
LWLTDLVYLDEAVPAVVQGKLSLAYVRAIAKVLGKTDYGLREIGCCAYNRLCFLRLFVVFVRLLVVFITDFVCEIVCCCLLGLVRWVEIFGVVFFKCFVCF